MSTRKLKWAFRAFFLSIPASLVIGTWFIPVTNRHPWDIYGRMHNLLECILAALGWGVMGIVGLVAIGMLMVTLTWFRLILLPAMWHVAFHGEEWHISKSWWTFFSETGSPTRSGGGP